MKQKQINNINSRRINEMLLFQAVQIADNYSDSDVLACLSGLDEKEQLVLEKYLFDLGKGNISKIGNDRIIRAIALIQDRRTAYLVKRT